jgi:hypothetical protein
LPADDLRHCLGLGHQQRYAIRINLARLYLLLHQLDVLLQRTNLPIETLAGEGTQNICNRQDALFLRNLLTYAPPRIDRIIELFVTRQQ